MSNITIKIESVLGGISPLQFFDSPGQYDAAIGIDPEFPVDDSSIRSSGYIRPTAFAKFSASEVTGVPLWIITNPKTSNAYVYANDGKVHTISSSIAMGTALNSGSALSSASGNGGGYYDNYAYFVKNTDIARYGPLDGTPSLVQNYWTSTLALTALANTTYPSIHGVAIPNHPTHRHSDGKFYIGDVASNNQGCLHYIKTTRTSVEGDTNSGSTYNALNFPYGYWPTAIETYGTDLAVALIEGSDTTIKQRRAKLSFWDTTSASFQKIIDVEFPDPLITALKNVNGVLYVWSGNASGGVRVSRFIGGYSFQEVLYLEEGVPPFQGAVDAEMNRVIWGGYVTYPEAAAVCFSLGMKKAALGPDALHVPFKSTSAGTTQMVTAVKFLEQANGSRKRPIMGWSDASAKGLDGISTTYGVNVWRSAYFRIGQPFEIKKLRFPVAQAIAANMTVVPKLIYDEGASSDTLTTINSTNYPNSERNIVKRPDAGGKHGFQLELRWTGSVLLTFGLPITIDLELTND